MSKDVDVALVAACAALLVSIVTLLGSLLNSRFNARTQRELEIIKSRMTRGSQTIALADKELQASLDGLQKCISAVQALKDELQLLLGSVEGSLPEQSLISRVCERRDAVARTYEEHSAVLTRQDDRAMHAAKNLSFGLVHLLENDTPTYVKGGMLTSEYAQQLSRVREGLSETQQVLRDSRSRLLEKRILSGE